MNIKKFVTILNYLSQKAPPLTKMKASKLLYFIDKKHFIDYGRFVTEDRYVKMQWGPVPSRILNIINCPEEYILDKDNKKYFDANLAISKDAKRIIKSKCPPDLDELSKSEITVMEQVIKKYGKCTITRLVDLGHREFAWKNAADADFISVEDMISGLDEDRKKELTDLYHAEKLEKHALTHIFG
jgi:uncharacterized phage-associated protein